MDKKKLTICVLISVFAIVNILTMFMPYFKIGASEVKKAFENSFELFEFNAETEDTSDETEDTSNETGDASDELVILDCRSGLKLVKDILDIKADSTYLNRLKTFTVSMLLTSWIVSIIIVLVIWLLKGKLKYILGMILSIVSFVPYLLIYFCIPGIAKHALVEAVEKSLFDDYGIYESLLGEYIQERVLELLGKFCWQLLQSSLQIGFWIGIISMILCTISTICGLIFEVKDVRKKNELKNAFIIGIEGTYAGARINIGDGIFIGRDAKVSNLVIHDDRISRRHCKIVYNDDTNTFDVTDYSRNGTYVIGGQRLDEKALTQLQPGTKIQLGKDGDIFQLG